MAQRTWTSASSTDWGTAGNWSGAATPVDGDNVLINNATAIAGYDANTINCATLMFGPDRDAATGSTGSYLIVSADRVGIACNKQTATNKDIYLDSGGTDAHDIIDIDSTARNQVIYLKATTTTPKLVIRSGTVKLISGTFTSVWIEWDGNGARPTLYLDGATVTNLYNGQDCIVYLTNASSTITNTYHDNGELYATAGTLTNIYQRGGMIDDQTTATTTTVDVYGGHFTAEHNDAGKTYTNFTTHGKARVNLQNYAGTIVVTNDVVNYGSEFIEFGDGLSVVVPS